MADIATVTNTSLRSPVLIPRPLHERLSLPLAHRLALSSSIGGFTGFVLGAAKGAQDCGFRYRAENAHRLPSTQYGWFLYHKSKNYNMMLGGIFEGFKQSLRFTLWVSAFFVLEEGVDRGRAAGARVRGELWGRERRGVEAEAEASRDCLSSMLAGLGTAGIFSAWNQFPVPTAARTAKMGAKAGLAFGILQDLLGLLKGRRVGYVEFIKRHTMGETQERRTST